MRSVLAASIALMLVPAAATAADTTPPTVAITTPGSGKTYSQYSRVVAQYSCSDPSGVASCTGTVPNGGAVDTSKYGQFSFQVNATDKAGNATTMNVRYTISCTSGNSACPPAPGSGGTPTLGTSGPSTGTHGSDVVVDPGTTVACPARGGGCTADESATAISPSAPRGHRVVLGRAHFAIPAGGKARLKLRLTRAGARLLRTHGRLRVTFTVRARAGAGPVITVTKSFPVRAPAR